jgi:hypothetical protein
MSFAFPEALSSERVAAAALPLSSAASLWLAGHVG